jgi:uncharacterized protein
VLGGPPDPAETNVHTVRQFMGAAGAERWHERCGLLHESFVVHETGGLPFSGDHQGSQGLFDLMQRMNDSLQLVAGPITLDPLGIDAVAARFRLTFISRASGDSVEMGIIEIYTLRDGQITELDVYYKDPSAVAALLTRS